MKASMKVGVAIGSGGVYSAAGLGVIEELERRGIEVPFTGGASAGAIVAALYYLEGEAKLTQKKLINKLPCLSKIGFNPLAKPISGEQMKVVVADLLEGRTWRDGKIQGVCFGTAYHDTKEPVILTRHSGLSLEDCVLASISLKMIEPVVELKGRIVTHGGDPDFIRGIRNLGADFVIKVSPNLEHGILGKMARLGNVLSSVMILRSEYLAVRKTQKGRQKERADMNIQPNVSFRPLVLPLTFSINNIQLMIKQGRILMDKSFPNLKEKLTSWKK